jgi:hypothetical protein
MRGNRKAEEHAPLVCAERQLLHLAVRDLGHEERVRDGRRGRRIGGERGGREGEHGRDRSGGGPAHELVALVDLVRLLRGQDDPRAAVALLQRRLKGVTRREHFGEGDHGVDR